MVAMRLTTTLSLLILLTAGSLRAQEPSCAASSAVWGGFPELPRVASTLRDERRLRVVALGSSSTKGVGASSADRTYPAQLERLLREAHPDARIEVVNRGMGGETIADNLARLDRDVLRLRPHLVIWQVGTNDALLGAAVAQVRADLQEGIRRIRRTGADVVLLDPQPLFEPGRAEALERIEMVLIDVASAAKVILLQRQALMRHWLASGQFAPETLLGRDRLHMTDASYFCLAVRIADLFRTRPGTSGQGRPTGPGP